MVRFLMSSVFLRLKNEAFFGRILFNRRFLKMFLVLDEINTQKLMIEMFKAKNDTGPKLLSEIFKAANYRVIKGKTPH